MPAFAVCDLVGHPGCSELADEALGVAGTRVVVVAGVGQLEDEVAPVDAVGDADQVLEKGPVISLVGRNPSAYGVSVRSTR